MAGDRTVVVLAAGDGERMNSSLPTLLHPLLGRTLLGHVLTATAALRPRRTIVVVGRGAEQVTAHLDEIGADAVTVLRQVQVGTGHAVREALDAGGPVGGTVVIVNADQPLLRAATLQSLVEAHESAAAAATALTTAVEHDAGTQTHPGVYAFEASLLSRTLATLSPSPHGGASLSNVIGQFVDAKHAVLAHAAGNPSETLGCEDRTELARLRAILRDRINDAWMRSGVTIVDPATTWIDVDVMLGRDVVVEPNTHLRGRTVVGEWAVIGPDTTLVDVTVGDGASVVRTHGDRAAVGPRATIGPFAYLRPGTRLSERTKVGAFVEVKNSEVGAGSKIPHLSYVGDATIGEETNIGAANVFVNYDGVNKHHTVIGSHVRTGSDTMLVAPVTVGDGAYTAAGSVITKDVPPGALGVARADQRNVVGWVQRRRPGTKAADAAAAALAATPEATPRRPDEGA